MERVELRNHRDTRDFRLDAHLRGVGPPLARRHDACGARPMPVHNTAARYVDQSSVERRPDDRLPAEIRAAGIARDRREHQRIAGVDRAAIGGNNHACDGIGIGSAGLAAARERKGGSDQQGQISAE